MVFRFARRHERLLRSRADYGPSDTHLRRRFASHVDSGAELRQSPIIERGPGAEHTVKWLSSPGEWTEPAGRRPGWSWVPLGAVARPDLMPGWVRVWYHTPFIDRYARSWMWRHGGWDVPEPG